MVKADIRIGTLDFELSYLADADEKLLCADWLPGGSQPPDFAHLAQEFSGTPFAFDLPDSFADFELLIERVGFRYAFKRARFEFHLVTAGYGSFVVATWPAGSARAFSFLLSLNQSFSLSGLPIIGAGLSADDKFFLDSFSVTVAGKTVTPGARLSLHIKELGAPIEISIPDTADAMGNSAEPAPPQWFDLNTTLGPLRLDRLGFRLDGGEVTVYINAGIRVSVLLLEVIGLYIRLPLKLDKWPAFGLEGAAVTINRPPVYISGGLFKSTKQGMTLYTGQLTVKISRFQLTALGSYGVFKDGTPSLFVFLMLGIPLGGSPIFFITGLAAAFGYNRAINLPSDVKRVREFPFVAAAMGTGSLKPGMTPAQVLQEMNETITPCADRYFASAGVRFTSFGIIESFVLVNAAFGERFELSVLGLSSLVLPPKSNKPFVSLQLALMAVIIPDDGYLTVQGALTSDSYVLCPECKAHGGFAVSVWYGASEHSGDFVITLGGYKDGYNVKHYPVVDRLGIDWRITDDLTLSSSLYFALTPSCVMMGGRLNIDYSNGRLKAWFHVYADFYMQWKPFMYSLIMGISLGASYRWDFFPFYKTFTIDLSANLCLWGPPFGGTAHISWFIISFTISFGAGKPAEAALDWRDFSSCFLGQNAAANVPSKLLDIRAVEGVIRSEEGRVPVCGSEQLVIEAVTRLPCTTAKLAGAVCRDAAGQDLPGIVPMKLGEYSSTLSVSARNSAGQTVSFEGRPITNNLPRALWDNTAPDPYATDSLKQGQCTGLRLSLSAPQPERVLPSTGSGFSMETLCRNEPLRERFFSYAAPKIPAPAGYPAADKLKYIEDTIMAPNCGRNRFLDTFARTYGTKAGNCVHMENWQSGLSEVLLSVPVLNRLGAPGIY